VQGVERNTGDPSAQPESGRGVSYKPKAKSSAVQRESEGVVVPVRAVKNNAAGGKDPWGGRVGGAGKREGMAGETGPNDPGGFGRARKCDNCNVGCGPGPSGHRGAVSMRCMTRSRGVTSCGRRGSG
jgi:hypothetical protein